MGVTIASNFSRIPEKLLATFREFLASWSEVLIKTPFLEGFCPFFCPVSYFFTDNLYIKCHFCKKKCSIWPSLAVAGYKVPPHIGGHHFLLCQQTNTKDIAGQSAMWDPHCGWVRLGGEIDTCFELESRVSRILEHWASCFAGSGFLSGEDNWEFTMTGLRAPLQTYQT